MLYGPQNSITHLCTESSKMLIITVSSSLTPHLVLVINHCTSVDEQLACGYMTIARSTNESRITKSTLYNIIQLLQLHSLINNELCSHPL